MRESRDRVRAAIKNSGFDIPTTEITINLAPADLKKEGSGFDLPMAIGILGAYGALQMKDSANSCWWVNWGWMGHCAAFPACCPLRSRRARVESPTLLFPERNAAEAAVVDGVNVYPVRTLNQVRELLNAAANGGIHVQPLRVDSQHLLGEHHSSLSTSKMCAGNRRPNAHWRFLPQGAITFL